MILNSDPALKKKPTRIIANQINIVLLIDLVLLDLLR